MEGRIKSIAEFRLIPEYLTNISYEGKNWLARAIVNILIVDKQLAPEEKRFFQRCDNDGRERKGSKRTDRVNQKP